VVGSKAREEDGSCCEDDALDRISLIIPGKLAAGMLVTDDSHDKSYNDYRPKKRENENINRL
jgi:hypothetical protein